jgi:hypothetical protein
VSGDPTLLGVAAIISAVGGIAATILAHRSAKKEERRKAEDECRERLRSTRDESERLAEELHRIKMKQFE